MFIWSVLGVITLQYANLPSCENTTQKRILCVLLYLMLLTPYPNQH